VLILLPACSLHQESIGQKIKIFGRNIEIVEVMKKKKRVRIFSVTAMIKTVYLPVNYFKTLVDLKDVGTTIAVKARPLVSKCGT